MAVIDSIAPAGSPENAAAVFVTHNAVTELNRLHLRRGRRTEPGRRGEILANAAFAEAHRLEPGAQFHAVLNGRRETLTVVGVALSPENINQIRGGDLLPAATRSPAAALLAMNIRSESDPRAPLVPLAELVRIEEIAGERNLYRNNLKPVTCVTADVAGAVESLACAKYGIDRAIRALDARKFGATAEALPIYHLNLPADDLAPALKWDGEWHIMLEVFRDLGRGFAAVLVLIAMLMAGWFKSYVTPLVVMAAIPFSLIGLLPADWGLGAFFTATSIIGFMAGAGSVVRNSIILFDFIELRRAQASPPRWPRVLAAEGFRAANAGSRNDWIESGWPVEQRSHAMTRQTRCDNPQSLP